MKAVEALVDRQIKRWDLERKIQVKKPAESAPVDTGPIITISRQRGSGGSLVAQRLAALTGFTHFNREIIDGVSREIGIQKRLVESLDEKVRSGFQLWVDGIIRGRLVDSSDYMQSLVKIIGTVIKHGKAIIVGRGANFIADPSTAFNIRIVANVENRIEALMDRWGLERIDAIDQINKTDDLRKKFIKNNFGADIDDPLMYDMIINSSNFSINQIASMILANYPSRLANIEQ